MGKHEYGHPVLPGLVEPGKPRPRETDLPQAGIVEPQKAKPILPRDLEQALTKLDEAELTRLAQAVSDEMRRRGLPAMTSENTARPPPTSSKTNAQKAPSAPNSATLSQSRMNAVRAAIKAGVKPTVVARQFGLSLPMVRKVIAEKQ